MTVTYQLDSDDVLDIIRDICRARHLARTISQHNVGQAWEQPSNSTLQLTSCPYPAVNVFGG